MTSYGTLGFDSNPLTVNEGKFPFSQKRYIKLRTSFNNLGILVFPINVKLSLMIPEKVSYNVDSESLHSF